ncbi:probable G-protein coupled receptor 156 [Eublepharis macularius]|uniref:Probable G-protein coupled receptor 156 n=1 Tax=Eublepharis macularius TaxID=481883 RepID=A0AA97KNV4_EUBMA|nr:probable G-protein coupled receptor 156 [Eublepharis macularius]
MMWLRGNFGCAVEMKLNHSNLCEGSYGCRSPAQQDNTVQDFCTIKISSSDNNCKSPPVSSAALRGIVWVLLTGGILLSCFFLIFTVRFRRNRIVKMSSPNLNVVTLLGSSLTYGSAYLFGIEKQNPLSGPSVEMLVQMRICLLCIGGSLAFGPILGKSWRLYKVFTQRVPDKRVNIKDLQLLIMVGALVGADIVLLSAWIFLDPVQCLQNLNADVKVTEKDLTCIVYRGYFCTSLYSDLWLFLFLGFKGVLLMYGAYLAGLTYDVSCPPVNQSLTLIVGITVIFLSAKMTLVVNRFFHSWHNLVFGTISGGIFVCTTTMNCLIFTPQVRQLKAFENQNEGVSHVAKFFTSSSKNFHSTIYSEEEIGQLIGEKNTMMHLLAEKDTAIAILQEQVNSAKEKLTRLVASEDDREAIDSPFPSAYSCPWDLSAADCSSKATEDTPRDLSLPGQEQNTWQILQFSNSPPIPGSSNKNECVGDPKCTSQPNLPPEIPDRCRPLSRAKNISDCSGGPDDRHKWLFQYAAPCSTGALQEPLRKNFSILSVGAEQDQVRPQLPGISYVSRDKLQEVLQELSMDHKASSQTSTRGAEQSAACEWSTGGWPQEIQATTLTRLSPFKIEAETKIPTCLPGSTVPDAWCIMNRRASRSQRSHSKISQFPWATESDTTEQHSLHQPLSFPSSVCKGRLNYKAENWSEHPSREESNWLLDKHPMENCAPLLCPGSPMTFHHQPRDFASRTAQLYLDSDSSSTASSGGARCCHHRHCCDLCHHSLSSSSDGCSTDMDSEPSISLYYGSNLFGKPQPIVNFNEDLEPTYV